MGGDCLTEREKSVAGLAALGFTNQEIARKLAISSSTVASHVSSILAKIGISERSQLMHKPGLLAMVERLSLGARERQILLSRLTGVSTAATAKRFHICQTTVRNYMRTIYRKLGVAGLRGVIRYLDQLEDPSASRPNLA
jgi:DNA-binding NarL/FixJ family response regulator